MGLLLRDDVFVDFFNTFLNLPVFGQTPIYISSTGRWDLWPELPSHLDPSPPVLLAWLEKHRLPHFCKSSLCLHFVLCQKLLGFIRSGEAAKLLNWQSADQWLLEKFISGTQGMWHFRAFIQGMAGEELTNFWLTTERLLGLDESDARQRDLYLSLFHRLKATHLREGSSIVTLCSTMVGLLPKAKHVQPTSTRRETLSKMQERALFMIQSYWLPKFFIHCKKGMEEDQSCWPLLQEYQERLLWANSQEPSGFSESLFMMHIKRSQGLSGPYCSKKAKAEIWTVAKEGRDTQEMKMSSFWVQPERQLGPVGSTKESHLDKDALGPIPPQSEHTAKTAFGGKGGATSPERPRPNAEQVLHLEDLCEEKVLSNLSSSTPLVQLPSLKEPVKTLCFLPWALSAESCAGRPFRDFLERQNRSMETLLLDLWHDLEEFLPVGLDPRRENSFFLRHLIGEKICKTYLEEGTIHQLPLEARTLRSLRYHLMSGEFSPWIFRAQKEICKVLCFFYEEFLADDDRTFLQFMSPQRDVPKPETQGHAVRKNECFLLSQRINASLKLSQALHGTRNLEGLSSEHWQLIATWDIQRGGSIQSDVEPLLCRTDAGSQKWISNKAAVQKPLLAGHGPNTENELVCLKSPSAAAERKKIKTTTTPPVSKKESSTMKSITVSAEKLPRRPRHFVKVLHNPVHLQYFKQFLEEHSADEPLRFWMAVEKLASETNSKAKSILVNNIVKTYFRGKIPAEERLDCHSAIIKEISEAKVVSPFMLMTAQIFVEKAMEKRWFKEYQDLLPPSDTPKFSLHLQYKMRDFKTSKLRSAWYGIRDIVRSICKFRKEMYNDKRRAEFEDFLRHELRDEEENSPISSKHSSSGSSSQSRTASLSSLPDKEMVLVRRRLFSRQLITINFLVNDLHFYLEIDKFSKLADSLDALADHNMQPEKEVAFLKKKVAIINKVFLNSDIPPKLRVNIPQDNRDLIWSLASKGLLNRVLYHKAKVTIFPILMYYWRRYCIWKVMRSFQVPRKDRVSVSSTSRKVSESSDNYNPKAQITPLQPQEKPQPPEGRKGLGKNLEKRLSLRKPASCPAEQAPRERRMSKKEQTSQHTIHPKQDRAVLQGS
nr:regulator of G-protein signaling protein-like isoform X2 [Columba livia]